VSIKAIFLQSYHRPEHSINPDVILFGKTLRRISGGRLEEVAQ
jgi:hypothetical protein